MEKKLFRVYYVDGNQRLFEAEDEESLWMYLTEPYNMICVGEPEEVEEVK